jgi:uncharacterized membrane protein YdjX (TVP38/TMEM64 family)
MQAWMKRALAGALILAVIFLAIRYYQDIVALLQDREQLQAWLQQLGPLGPLGLILVNAAQVVVAPIPGYAMQCASGYLFGWIPGAIYAAVGMSLGGAAAMMLARAFGRPLVSRFVGAERLARWEAVAHLDSILVWVILMLGFFGDVPYFIAGLTTVAVWKIVLIALVTRMPSVLVVSGLCSGAVDVDIAWRSPWVLGAILVLLIVGAIATRYQKRIEAWIDNTVLTRLSATSGQAEPAAVDDQVPAGES